MTTPVAGSPPAKAQGEQLPPELQVLVKELALAVQKRSIYPASHPMLRGSMETLARRFHVVQEGGRQVTIGVSRHRLVVEGIATDENNPQLADLAERLYEHELGAVTFEPDVPRVALEEFIAAICLSPSRGDEALGAVERSRLNRWTDITLTRVGFDRLELRDAPPEEVERADPRSRRFDTLWLGIARAVLAGGALDGSLEDPRRLAEAIQREVNKDGFDETILNFLRQLVGELEGEAAGSVLRRRASELLQNLDDASLSRLLQLGGDSGARKGFLEGACDSLAASAVLRLVRAASREAGVPIAGAMLRLLGKLARDSDSRQPGSRNADRAFRGVIRRMLVDWKLVDPNPDAYTLVLSDIAATGRSNGQAYLGRDECEPERILQIGLACDSLGPSVESALARLIVARGVAGVVDCLMECAPSMLRDSLMDRLINEASFKEELAYNRPALPVLQHAVARLGVRSVAPLVSELDRRGDGDASWIVELLVAVGHRGIPLIGEELSSVSSRALRHLIAVFDRLDGWPVAADAHALACHNDPSVRREAIRSLLKREATREAGLLAGVRDHDIRIFNLAMGAISGPCTPEVARAAMSRLEGADMSDELRARGIRALGETRHEEVRRWMEQRAATRHWLFRTWRLRKPSLELCAILAALAAQSDDDPGTQRILVLATKHRSADVRRAALPRASLTAAP